MNEPAKGEFVCIVDDEPMVLRALQRELRDYFLEKELEVLIFESARECLDRLREIGDKTAIIISDLRMPGMGGADFLLKVREIYPEVELILLTAYEDFHEVRKAVPARLRAVLTKPWSVDILQTEIQSALEFRRIRDENRRYLERINSQLQIAGEFQRELMAVSIPDLDGLRMNISYLPRSNQQVGGDFYDVIGIDSKHCLVLLGDVTGQGVRPAFITAMLKVLSSSFAVRNRADSLTPALLMNSFNAQISKTLEKSADVLISFCCLLVNLDKMELTISTAGHFPVYLINSDGCRELSQSGPAMGFSPSLRYEEQRVPLSSGDSIAVHSNGLLASSREGTRVSSQVVQRYLTMAERSGSFNESFLKEIKLVRGIDEFLDDVTLISMELC